MLAFCKGSPFWRPLFMVRHSGQSLQASTISASPFRLLSCCRPSASGNGFRKGSSSIRGFGTLRTLSRCFTRSASARLPLSFRSGTLRTLVIVSERSHTTVNLFILVSCLFSTSPRLQQLRCVLIAQPKAPRKAPLFCLFVRVTVFTNCNVVK